MAIETKLSKQQYAALLDRTMNRKPVADQQSSMMDIQGQMDSAMPEPLMDPTVQMPSANPQMAGQQLGSIPMQEDPQAMQMAMQASQPQGMAGAIQQAEQTYMKLKGTVGEQLWKRLAATSAETMGKNPDGAFIQTMVKFMRDPNSITDPNIKEFLTSMVGAQPQMAQGLESAMPQLMQAMSFGKQGGMM